MRIIKYNLFVTILDRTGREYIRELHFNLVKLKTRIYFKQKIEIVMKKKKYSK